MNSFTLKYIALIIFCALASVAMGQQSFRISISEKHKQKIEKVKDPREKLRLYKKYYTKDSLKYIRSLDKKLKQQSDSIYETMRKWESKKQQLQEKVKNNRLMQQAEKVGIHPPGPLQGVSGASSGRSGALIGKVGVDKPGEKLDSVTKNLTVDKTPLSINGLQKQLPDDDPLPTTKAIEKPLGEIKQKVKNQIGDKAGGIKEALSPYQQYYSQYKDYLNNPDSMKVMIRKVAEKELESLPERLTEKAGTLGKGGMKQLTQQKALADKIKGMPDKYKAQMEQLGDSEQMKTKGKSLAKEKAVEYLKANQDVIAAAQKKMTKLKKIYSKVTNSNDLSTAVKRNSLKGKPFKERLFIGGNFQVINLDPFSIDMSPSLGYRWNKKFITGIGIIYRHTFGEYDSTQSVIPEQSYGLSAFAQYDVYKGFFAFATYEQTSQQLFDQGQDRPAQSFVPGMMVGAGKTASIHPKLNTQFVVLYNFLHEQGVSPYKSPWVIKAGFSLK